MFWHFANIGWWYNGNWYEDNKILLKCVVVSRIEHVNTILVGQRIAFNFNVKTNWASYEIS